MRVLLRLSLWHSLMRQRLRSSCVCQSVRYNLSNRLSAVMHLAKKTIATGAWSWTCRLAPSLFAATLCAGCDLLMRAIPLPKAATDEEITARAKATQTEFEKKLNEKTSPSPAPALRSSSRLRTASELTSEERLYVAGAMAGAGCESVRGNHSEHVAFGFYRSLLRSRGIEPESTFQDEAIVYASKVVFSAKCR